MKLTAFQYGKTELAESFIFKGGSPDVKRPISLVFFLIENEGRKILVDVGCDTMPGFELFEFKKPVELLEERGIGREEITDVIITHPHHDHVDAVRYYPHAKIYINSEALPHAAEYLKDNQRVVVVGESAEIASGVVMKCISGHFFGSSIVTVNSSYVLCGDECYTRENLEKKLPTASTVNPQKSLEFVCEYSKKCYTPILFHDPELVGEIGVKVIFEC
jgi:glyoxylase-like metal-dependent hydrolase (beta-lactamase superfamily II)